MLEPLEERTVLSTFTVSVAGDTNGPNPLVHNLRWAVQSANAPGNAGSTIDFAIDDNVQLLNGPLTISQPTTIDATGFTVTVDGRGTTQDFVIPTSVNVNFIGDSTVAGGAFTMPFTITGGYANGAMGNDVNGGAIDAKHPNAALSLQNVVVTGNKALMNGGGVYSAGSLGVYNSNISNDMAIRGNGGGLYANKMLTIGGSLLTNDTALINGGAVYQGPLGTLNILAASPTLATPLTPNSVFDADRALTGSGGAVWAYFNINDTGSSYTNNTALMNGGAIDSMAGSVTLTGDFLMNNKAGNPMQTTGNGGAVWANLNVTAQAGAFITDNTAGLAGGGIYASRGSVLVDASFVNDNIARSGAGGGVWAGSNTTIVDLGAVDGNLAGGNGGGVYALGNVTVVNSSVSGNTSGGSGGGIANGTISNGSSTITLRGATVNGNTASGNGGGVYTPFGVIDVLWYTTGGVTLPVISSVSNNNAGGNGGGLYDGGGMINLYAQTGDKLANQVLIDGNRAVGLGGGIYIGSFGVLTVVDPALPAGVLGTIEITNNTATSGGGFYADAAQSVTLNNTLVAYNTADLDGGGGLAFDTLYIDIYDTTFASNTSMSGSGGGLAVEGSANGFTYLHIDDSTFGAFSETLNPLTGQGAQSALNGGGLYMDGPGVMGDLNHVTFNDNLAYLYGSAIDVGSGATLYLENVLVDDTNGLSPYTDLISNIDFIGPGTIISSGHNMSSDASLMYNVVNYNTANGDLADAFLPLSILVNHGGSTPTYALVMGSQAIGAGDSVVLVLADQDGNPWTVPTSVGSTNTVV